MRKIRLTSLSTIVSLLLILLTVPSCNEPGQIIEFEFLTGYQNIPVNADYQDMQIIQGKINSNSIAIHFIENTFSPGKGKNESNRNLELTGEEYQKCLNLVQNTSFREREAKEILPGGPAFKVSLISGNGQNKQGYPSNKDDWVRFAEKIKQMSHRLKFG